MSRSTSLQYPKRELPSPHQMEHSTCNPFASLAPSSSALSSPSSLDPHISGARKRVRTSSEGSLRSFGCSLHYLAFALSFKARTRPAACLVCSSPRSFQRICWDSCLARLFSFRALCWPSPLSKQFSMGGSSTSGLVSLFNTRIKPLCLLVL